MAFNDHPPNVHPPRWFDGRVSVGNLLTMLMIVIGGATAWAELKSNNSRQDADIAALQHADDELRKTTKDLSETLRRETDGIKTRSEIIVDKLLERQLQTIERITGVEVKIDAMLKSMNGAAEKEAKRK